MKTSLTTSTVTSRDPKGLKFMQNCEAAYNKAGLGEDQAQQLNEDKEFWKQMTFLIDKHSQTDDQFELVGTFEVTVPEGYDHATRLTAFGKEHRKEFYYYNKAITDTNYANATTKLVPGRKFQVKVFQVKGTVADQCYNHSMKTLRDIEHLSGVKALVRVDFNVSIENGTVVDDTRIRAALPTIDLLRTKGAKVILVSHLESSDGGNPSLQPVANYMKDKLGISVMFVRNIRTANDLIENSLINGQCMLLENLRQFPGEKANDQGFARELASLGDLYVNDAFSVSHREHASIVSVPKFLPSYAGLQLEKEIANLSKVFDPAHPFLFILGGAKFETKLPLLAKFMGLADTVFVGGALANDFYRAKGYETGTSLLSKGNLDLAPFLASPKLMLPADVIDENKAVKKPEALGAADMIMDAGPQTVAALQDKINTSKFILWNGPLGMYEEGYRQPTLDLAKMIGEATLHGVETIVGGGDTLAAITELGIDDEFSFVSTGGGAMLDFLAKGTLPGIEALNASTL